MGQPRVQARVTCTTVGNVCGWLTHVCCRVSELPKGRRNIGWVSSLSVPPATNIFPSQTGKRGRVGEQSRGPRTCWALHISHTRGQQPVDRAQATRCFGRALPWVCQGRKLTIVHNLQTQAKVVPMLGKGGRTQPSQLHTSLLEALSMPPFLSQSSVKDHGCIQQVTTSV